MNPATEREEFRRVLFRPIMSVLVLGALIFLLGLGLYAAQTGWTAAATHFLALDSTHIWWYLSRSAGVMAYLLLWLSTLLGFAVSAKFIDPLLERVFTYDFHEHLSLLSLGFVALHALVLLFDPYEPLSLAELLVPFISSYRPFWVGLGVIGLYLSALVTVTYYIRSWIGMRAFRRLHYLSVAAYLGSLLHGWFAGTDSALPMMAGIYKGTTLTTLFFLMYWLAWSWMDRRERRVRPGPSEPTAE